MQYSKTVYKKMRELSGKAYEKELRGELEKLAEQFQLWRDTRIDTWDLVEAVHKFHNGPAKKTLYTRSLIANWDTISVPLDIIRVYRPTDIFRV